MKIKIIETPPGFAPDEIRKAWLGLVIITSGREVKAGFFRSSFENIGGYKVLWVDAIAALKEAKLTEAADYWSKFHTSFGGDYLVFKTQCCEEVNN